MQLAMQQVMVSDEYVCAKLAITQYISWMTFYGLAFAGVVTSRRPSMYIATSMYKYRKEQRDNRFVATFHRLKSVPVLVPHIYCIRQSLYDKSILCMCILYNRHAKIRNMLIRNFLKEKASMVVNEDCVLRFSNPRYNYYCIIHRIDEPLT